MPQRFGETLTEHVLPVFEMDTNSSPEGCLKITVIRFPSDDLGIGSCEVGIDYHLSMVGDENLPNVGEAETLGYLFHATLLYCQIHPRRET
jgi:hypothetical protein